MKCHGDTQIMCCPRKWTEKGLGGVFCPLVQTGKVYSFFTHSWKPLHTKELKKQGRSLSREQPDLFLCWLLNPDANLGRCTLEIHQQTDMKIQKTLYKATASSTKHLTAKVGQVSQLLLWAAHTSVLAYAACNCYGYQEHRFLLPLKIN